MASPLSVLIFLHLSFFVFCEGRRGQGYGATKACTAFQRDVEPCGPSDIEKVNLGFENVCGLSPPTRLVSASAMVHLRCCIARTTNVSWSFAKNDSANFEPICSNHSFSHRNILSIFGKSYGIKRFFDGYYRCRLRFEDGNIREVTQRLVSSKESVDHSKPPTFTERKKKVSAVWGLNTKLSCQLKVSFRPGATVELHIIKGSQRLANYSLHPYCLRMRRYLEPEVGQTSHLNQSSVLLSRSADEKTKQFDFVVVTVGETVTLGFVFQQIKSSFNLTVRALQPSVSKQSTDLTISVDVKQKERTKPLPNVWKITVTVLPFIAITTVALLLLVFRRDLHLLTLKTARLWSRCSPLPAREPIKIAVLLSNSASATTAAFADHLMAHLTEHFTARMRFELLPLEPLAGTCTASVLAAAGASGLSIVLLDSVSLQSDLFVGQLKILLLRPAAWRMYVLMESLRHIKTAQEEVLLQRLRVDVRHRDVIRDSRFVPQKWLQHQACLSLEIHGLRAGA